MHKPRMSWKPIGWALGLTVAAVAVVVGLGWLAYAAWDDDHRAAPTCPGKMLGDTRPMPVPTGPLDGPYVPYQPKPLPKPAPKPQAPPVPPKAPSYRLTPMAR